MNASDVMVRDVITVGPESTVREVAKILLANRISGVPVVDSRGQLVGIVSEGDLLHRPEAGTERPTSWWLAFFASTEIMAADFVKSHSRKVVDIMTRQVITAAPETPLAQIAALLEKNGIKRVPIVKDGKLVGIVSRANLLQALASLPAEVRPKAIDDSALRERVLAQINSKPWTRPALINAIVHDGTVELWGIVATQAEKDAIRVAAEVTPGVRAVSDNMSVRPISTWS